MASYGKECERERRSSRQTVGLLLTTWAIDDCDCILPVLSYTDADGKEYTVNYVADENGYRAEGSHLPGSSEGSPSTFDIIPTASTSTSSSSSPSPSSAASGSKKKATVLPGVYPYTAYPFYRGTYKLPPYFNYGNFPYMTYPYNYAGYGVNLAYPYLF